MARVVGRLWEWATTKPERVVIVLVLAVIAVLALIWLPPWFAGMEAAPPLNKLPRVWSARVDTYRQTVVQVLGGIVVAFGLFVALHRSMAAMRMAAATEEGNTIERFTRAINHLGELNPGDNKPAVVARLGGIYSLEQIAKKAPAEYHREVIEVLAAYVRVRVPSYPGIFDFYGLHTVPEEEKPDVYVGSSKPDEDVQAALVVIAHLGPADGQLINLRHKWLKGAFFPKGAKLQDVDFDSANLMDADFTGATLNRANFLHANLRGAWFSNAEMNETSLTNASLTWPDSGGEDRKLTNLQGASLRRAAFDHADMNGALLQGADLSEARRLTRLQICSSNFDENTTMPDGKLGYTKAQICDEKVDVGLWDEMKKAFEQQAVAEVKAKREQNEEESGEDT